MLEATGDYIGFVSNKTEPQFVNKLVFPGVSALSARSEAVVQITPRTHARKALRTETFPDCDVYIAKVDLQFSTLSFLRME